MTSPKLFNVQEGIWLDRSLLQEAGLGKEVQISVASGEIKISAAEKREEAEDTNEKLWTSEAKAIFLSLGENAVAGELKDTSVHHDRYLYGQPE